jgi:hypothetical protein
MGRLAMETIGLGILQESGLKRVPKPPAMITAFISLSLLESKFELKVAKNQTTRKSTQYMLNIFLRLR